MLLDEKSPVPLYYQLQEILRARIESGQWKSGEQVPPEADLCAEFGLSRGTVRQALADLVRDGMLNRRRGKGSFVTKPKISQDVLSLSTDFSEYASRILGEELGNQLVSVAVVPSNASMARALEIPEGAEVVEVRKLKLMQGRPYFLATSYVPPERAAGLENDDHSQGSISELLRDKYGFRVGRATGWFEPVRVNEYESTLLKVEKGSPAMLIHRVRYHSDGVPFLATRHLVRGDMCRLSFESGNGA